MKKELHKNVGGERFHHPQLHPPTPQPPTPRRVPTPLRICI